MESDITPHETRERILHAATQLFGELGYKGTTVAAVCHEASANIAAVNYYFRGKDALYVEAWRSSFIKSLERHPPDGGVPSTAPAEERLRGWIRSMIERISDPESHDFEIAHMEFANPTGLLTDVMKDCIAPMEKGLQEILGLLLEKENSQENIQLCSMSVRAQCLNPQVIRKRHHSLHRKANLPGPPPLPHDVEDIIHHVMEFSLAGIKSIANQKKTKSQRRTSK